MHVVCTKMKKLTNTFKLAHTNKHNTNENSHLYVEEFHTLHALSLCILSMAE
jgi:hypothetical protein